jgi:hypothetical protein
LVDVSTKLLHEARDYIQLTLFCCDEQRSVAIIISLVDVSTKVFHKARDYIEPTLFGCDDQRSASIIIS